MPLRELMSAIHRIGKYVYPDERSETGERLYVHQMGDGFAIVSDSHESLLGRPISVATALMRHVVATTGGFPSAAIAEGNLADIRSCYPEEVLNDRHDGDYNTVSLGRGIMIISTVMGSAFIRAYKLSNAVKPSWPFLIMSESNRDRVPSELSRKTAPCHILSINWVESQMPLVAEIQRKAGLSDLSPDEFRQKIQDYDMSYSEVVRKWKEPLCDYLNLRFGNFGI